MSLSISRVGVTDQTAICPFDQSSDEKLPLRIPRQFHTNAKKLNRRLTRPEDFKPSLLAGADPALVKSSLTLQLIDQAFLRAIADYQKMYVNAKARDMQKAKDMQEMQGPIGTSYDVVLYVALQGARDLVRLDPNVEYLEPFTKSLLCLLGAMWGMTFGRGGYKKQMQEELASEHRAKFIHDVETLEAKRMREGARLIDKRLLVLAEMIQANSKRELVDQNLAKEFEVLTFLASLLSPQESLQIEGMHALDWLKKNS